MTHTTTTYNISVLPSKKDILYRLFNAGHITFDELFLLAEDTIIHNYLTNNPVVSFPNPYYLEPVNTCQ